MTALVRNRMRPSRGALVVAVAALALSSQTHAAEDGWSEDWGGGRLYVQGREIAPPLWFTGFGGSVLYANKIQVDPWPCDPLPEYPAGPVCGTMPRPDDDPQAHQELVVDRILALSSLPLVMIGCDYSYRPLPEEAARVLLALDAGDIEAAVAAGAPAEAARDLRLAQGSSE